MINFKVSKEAKQSAITTQKLTNIENILKILNKLCYYSSNLSKVAFEAGLVQEIGEIIDICQVNPSSKGKDIYFKLLITVPKKILHSLQSYSKLLA